MHKTILDNAFDSERNTFVGSLGGDEVDGSLLLLLELGFVDASDPRYVGTVNAVEKLLRRGKHLFRYAIEDDFGVPQNAFNVCTFWYIDALAALGRRDEARELFENMLDSRNPWACCRRTSTPKPGNCGEISRKPIPWSG